MREEFLTFDEWVDFNKHYIYNVYGEILNTEEYDHIKALPFRGYVNKPEIRVNDNILKAITMKVMDIQHLKALNDIHKCFLYSVEKIVAINFAVNYKEYYYEIFVVRYIES